MLQAPYLNLEALTEWKTTSKFFQSFPLRVLAFIISKTNTKMTKRNYFTMFTLEQKLFLLNMCIQFVSGCTTRKHASAICNIFAQSNLIASMTNPRTMNFMSYLKSLFSNWLYEKKLSFLPFCPSTLLSGDLTWSAVSSSRVLSTGRTLSCWEQSRGGPQRWSEGWIPSPMRKGWEGWGLFSLDMRRLQEDLIEPSTACRKTGEGFFMRSWWLDKGEWL